MGEPLKSPPFAKRTMENGCGFMKRCGKPMTMQDLCAPLLEILFTKPIFSLHALAAYIFPQFSGPSDASKVVRGSDHERLLLKL